MSNLPNIVNDRLSRLNRAIAGDDPKDRQQEALADLIDILRGCWPTPVPPLQNKTRLDAIARVLRARNGCLVEASTEYLDQMVHLLRFWLELIEAEMRKQAAETDLKETIRTLEEIEEELHEDPEPEF